jgi:hypothetical protein
MQAVSRIVLGTLKAKLFPHFLIFERIYTSQYSCKKYIHYIYMILPQIATIICNHQKFLAI